MNLEIYSAGDAVMVPFQPPPATDSASIPCNPPSPPATPVRLTIRTDRSGQVREKRGSRSR